MPLIRILNIVTQMNQAGMENRLMDIYNEINTDIIQFDFYTFRKEKGDYDSIINMMGGKLYYNSPISVLNIIKRYKELSSFLKNHPEYKIVHCHMNQWSGLLLKGAKDAGVGVRIAHSRTALNKISIKNIIKNLIKTPTNKYANYKFAVSDKAGKWLFGNKTVIGKDYYVIPNAIDCNRYRFDESIRIQIRNCLNINNDFIVMHVGNIRPEKNHKFLLKIFTEILKIKSNAKLYIVGKDYMNGEIQKEAQKYGIDKYIYFLGQRSDVDKLLQIADAFVFPSIYEGFPGAVLEAQASGLPCYISDVITSDVCITDLVTKLSLNLKPEIWAEKIINFVSINRESAADKLIEKGYDISSVAMFYQNFYEKVFDDDIKETFNVD